MHRLLITTFTFVLFATPALSSGITVLPNPDMQGVTIPTSILQVPAGGETFGFDGSGPDLVSLSKMTTLNCQNDGTPSPRNTLVIAAPDLAGTIFAAPSTPNPYGVTEVRIGLLDFNAVFPLTLDLAIFEDNLAGSFEEVFAGTVTVDSDWGGFQSTTVLSVDLSSFGIILQNDLLLLYGDQAATSAPAGAFPVADTSPRCFTSGSNDDICSVVADFVQGQLFIYGVTDPLNCPTAVNNIRLFDIVCEVDVVEPAVSSVPASWGTLKSKY